MRRHKLIIALAVAALLAVFAVSNRKPVEVETVAVTRGDIEENVTAVGTLLPQSYVDVGAQVSGQIKRIHVRVGAAVQKDQLLIEIDPSVQQATVDAGEAALAGLRAQLAEQRAQLELAQQQLARQQRMAADGATREEDVQTAQANLQSAIARIDNLQAQIDQTQSTLKGDRARLGYTKMFAPMAGTVVALDAREGQTINATQQAPIVMRIADLSAMTVWTEVSEADIKRIEPGMPVYFSTIGMQERTWSSKVRQILPAPPMAQEKASSPSAPVSAGKVVAYTVLFDVPNPGGELMSQMTAQVFFVLQRSKNVVMAPLAALKAHQATASGAYTASVRMHDGAIVSRDVRIGTTNRVMAEVLTGLREGEQLVIGTIAGEITQPLFQW